MKYTDGKVASGVLCIDSHTANKQSNELTHSRDYPSIRSQTSEAEYWVSETSDETRCVCVCDVRISGKCFRTWAIFSYRRHTATHRRQRNISHLFRGVFTRAVLSLIRCENVAFTQTEVKRCVCARRIARWIHRARHTKQSHFNQQYLWSSHSRLEQSTRCTPPPSRCLSRSFFFLKQSFSICHSTFATNTYTLQFASFAEFSQAVWHHAIQHLHKCFRNNTHTHHGYIDGSFAFVTSKLDGFLFSLSSSSSSADDEAKKKKTTTTTALARLGCVINRIQLENCVILDWWWASIHKIVSHCSRYLHCWIHWFSAFLSISISNDTTNANWVSINASALSLVDMFLSHAVLSASVCSCLFCTGKQSTFGTYEMCSISLVFLLVFFFAAFFFASIQSECRQEASKLHREEKAYNDEHQQHSAIQPEWVNWVSECERERTIESNKLNLNLLPKQLASSFNVWHFTWSSQMRIY